MSVHIQNLLKTYGSQKAVNNISFTIRPGEIVGFLGPNGAGKSTTMKMITGYLEPDGGEISVSGIDVRRQPLEVKKKIGYLPESNALYYDMYVREYLDFIADVHHLSRKKEKTEEVIRLTGLLPESKKKLGQLSKGYKQRAGLAAALLHEPEVLILDEPTSGLDPNQIVEIRQVIRDQGKNKIVLFSSHILQEVEAICDRVIIINKGTIVADDALANLQKHTTVNRVHVEFKEAVEEGWLRQIAQVSAVQKKEGNRWTLDTADPEAVRRQLLQLSLQHNRNIVSLQNENQSLEAIFRSLTTNKEENIEQGTRNVE